MRLAQFTLLFSAFTLLFSISACNDSGSSTGQSTSDGSKLLLRLNLDDQEKMNYVVEMDYKTSMNFMGAIQEMDMDMLMEYSMDIKEKGKDGITIVDLTTKRMKMNVDMPLGGGSLKFDSQNPDASDARSEMMADMLGNYIGESLEIKINEKTRNEDIGGQEKISEKMKNSGGGMVGNN